MRYGFNSSTFSARTPVRPYLSRYAGPLPLPVVPIAPPPFLSSALCASVMTCVLFAMKILPLVTTPPSFNILISRKNCTGSTTQPEPMMERTPKKTPAGMWWVMNLTPLWKIVWPALHPPLYRRTCVYFFVLLKKWATLPFPQSPYWRSTITSTFNFDFDTATLCYHSHSKTQNKTVPRQRDACGIRSSSLEKLGRLPHFRCAAYVPHSFQSMKDHFPDKASFQVFEVNAPAKFGA